MPTSYQSLLARIFSAHEAALLDDWLQRQQEGSAALRERATQAQLRQDSKQFLLALTQALNDEAAGADMKGSAWREVREFLGALSAERARMGFSPTETATFIFSLKQPLFELLRRELEGDARALAQETWSVSVLLDNLGLFTMEAYQRSREELISRQQQELLELSTPVVQLWENIVALPLIGTLDSHRTQIVMESLLQRIVDTGCTIAIIDITGVPMVDTLVAQHLLKTVAAARLMGADCIISGIRPQIAQTIVHLGVDLSEVTTKATLADAFLVALQRNGASLAASAARA